MHISSAVSAPQRRPSPLRSSNLIRRPSPLNPLLKPRASTQTLKTPGQTQVPNNSTLTHLLKLERLLQKPDADHLPPPPKPEPSRGPTTTSNVTSWSFLNLSGILPARRKAEEMSPRSLNHLQRLLSDSNRQSPRNYIAGQWRELHGEYDWSGLLDPLDENLRRELVRYGEFVQAAYQAFNTNPAFDGTIESTRQVPVPDPSYKVTKSLYATSSIDLPNWVDALAPPWMKQRSSWIGYVAVCDGEREIQRMGRRDIVISLRGTATCLEWAENFRDLLVKIPDDQVTDASIQPKVECGFWSLFKTRSEHVPSLSESVVEEVRRLIDLYKGEELSITVTGHSLGAALGLLVADELSTCCPNPPPIAVFSFGGPRVGSRGFTQRVEGKGVKVLRVVNEQDVVTRVPGLFASEAVDRRLRTGEWSHVLDAVDGVMPWAYAHVGRELRVDTRLSPYLKPNADPGCCHDLEAYLHLVDGFLGSHRPFRSNAKRSIARLMCQQGSNMKKFYTSKALSLKRKEVAGVVPACLPSPSSS